MALQTERRATEADAEADYEFGSGDAYEYADYGRHAGAAEISRRRDQRRRKIVELGLTPDILTTASPFAILPLQPPARSLVWMIFLTRKLGKEATGKSRIEEEEDK